ncbi:MAG: hypothetical protein AAFR87_20345 [Bacteroidota bacterium]
MSEEERSESGNPIFRDEAKDDGFISAHGNEVNIEAIRDHIEEHIGPIESVFHEIISHLVHIKQLSWHLMKLWLLAIAVLVA